MSIYESLKELFISMFHERGESAIPFLCNSSIPKEVFLCYYKNLPPIEGMPEREKTEMKAFVNDLFPEKTIEEKVDACKIIYTIGTLL